MTTKLRVKKIKKKDTKRSKPFFEEIEDWMIGQPNEDGKSK